MDQPARAEIPQLKGHPDSIEVIETSRAFPRPGFVPGIDSLRRHLLYVSWAGFHCVPLRNANRAHAR